MTNWHCVNFPCSQNGVKIAFTFIAREPVQTKRCWVEAYRRQVCEADIGCFPSFQSVCWQPGCWPAWPLGWCPSLAWRGPAWPSASRMFSLIPLRDLNWARGIWGSFRTRAQDRRRILAGVVLLVLLAVVVGGGGAAASCSLSPGVAESHIRLNWWTGEKSGFGSCT